jgi:hypothetical protein
MLARSYRKQLSAADRKPWSHLGQHNSPGPASLDVAHLGVELLELLLDRGVLLGHLLVLGLPRIALGLESLDFPLKVSGLDVCLAEPVIVT